MNTLTILFRHSLDGAVRGHVHCCSDFTVGTTCVIKNPKEVGPCSLGLRWKNRDFHPLFPFEI
jgi:hypothetical protein